MIRTWSILLLIAILGVWPLSTAGAQPVLFDFENAPLYSPLPISLTVGGIVANFSATGQGYSFQMADVMGFTPVGFSGKCVYPSSVYASDLLVAFPNATLTDFSILYAPEEYACDSSATMRVTGYMNNVFVATNTTTAYPPGTWPSATLSLSYAQGFNSVVVHYDAPPPTGGDYGPIFMADNMWVTPKAAPPACRGDFNCDHTISFADIDPFVAVLGGGACCDPTGQNCDVNGDGAVNFSDIDPFVALLTSGATCP